MCTGWMTQTVGDLYIGRFGVTGDAAQRVVYRQKCGKQDDGKPRVM
jgi:hypothetical protein